MTTPIPTPRFSIHPISIPTDYPALTTLSLVAFQSNPLHYLTFRPSSSIPPEVISEYHRRTRIELHGEGSAVKTFKIVDNFPEDGTSGQGKIAGFASWVFDHSWPLVEGVEMPQGADLRFLNAFREQVNILAGKVFQKEDNAIELHLMRVHPSYQGQGLGSMLLSGRLEEAKREGKKIFLMASPSGRGLYLRWGFKVVGEVRLRVKDFMDEAEIKQWEGVRTEEEMRREEVYVQSLMVWELVENEINIVYL